MKDKMERVARAVTQFCEVANVQDEFLHDSSRTSRTWRAILRIPRKILKRNFFISIQGPDGVTGRNLYGHRKDAAGQVQQEGFAGHLDGGDNHSRYGEHE